MSSWLLLLLWLQFSCLSNGLITNSILKSNRAAVQTILYGVGSDVLQRPEDENSPEFRDYLKNLMKMQANRAKGGFAAPSSGSSDAYVAKLNRLKIERQALRDAGFPDVEIDTSYKEEDFKAALYEAQEPLVSSTVLTGEAAIPGRKKAGGKMRPLSHEELAAQEAAERTVEEVLKRNPATLVPQVTMDGDENPYARLMAERSGQRSPEEDAIDNILEKALNKKQPPAAKQQQQPIQRTPHYTPPPPRPPAPVPIAAPVAPLVAAAVPLRPLAPVSPVTAAVPLRPVTPTQVAPPAPATALRQPTAAVPLRPLPPTPVVPSSAVEAAKGKKMSPEDLEVAAEALKLLVKHRGGGPFGVGRLRTGAEVSSLESSLRETVSVLRSLDSNNAAAAAAAVPVRSPVPVAKPVPVISQIQAPPAPTPSLPPVPKVQATPQLPVAVQQQRAQMPAAPLATVADASAPVPIALGLDQFLQAPVAKTDEELGALRDGLIQVLAMIQSELAGRSLPSGSSSQVSQVPDAAAANRAAADRIMRLNAPASVAQTQEGSGGGAVSAIPVDQDIKQAMGLLLKHRGGPGFGHGRLEGKELDWMTEKLRSVSQRLVAEASESGR